MLPQSSASRPLSLGLGTLLAPALPLVIGIWRASFGSQWRDDQALLAAVGKGPPGLQGAFSALLGSVAIELPLGGKWLRVALVSVVGLSLASFLIFSFTRYLSRLLGVSTGTASAAALGAAWLVTLSPSWQLEATVAGGLTVAAALGLLGLWLSREPEEPWVPMALGVVMGIALAENWTAAVGLALALAARFLLRRGPLPWSRRVQCVSIGLCALVAGGLTLGQLVRSGGTWADLGVALAGDLGVATAAHDPLRLLDENFTLLGVGLAALGFAAALFRSSTRALGLALLVWCGLGGVGSRLGEDLLGADPLASFALLGLAAIGIFAGAGAAAAFTLTRLRVPLARQSVGLLVTALFVLVLLGFERSSHLAARRDHVASEAWTDEALSDLPPGGVLLLETPELAWHLWAAREIGGQRPDLIVVPLPSLERGSGTEQLLRLEAGLGPVIRDVRLSRRPTEYALSALSVERPLFVQFDPTWDPRLREHLVPHGFWVRFSPHALGRSDREGAAVESDRAFSRVVSLAEQPGVRDPGTLQVLQEQLAEHALMLFAFHDYAAGSLFAEKLRLIAPQHPALASLVVPKTLAAATPVD